MKHTTMKAMLAAVIVAAGGVHHRAVVSRGDLAVAKGRGLWYYILQEGSRK